MNIFLTISSYQQDSDDIQELTRNLTETINQETELRAALADEEPRLGSKGDITTIGTIMLTFLTGGGGVALIRVLRAYIDRGSNIEMKLKRRNGESITVNATNINAPEIRDLVDNFFSATK